MSLNFSSHYKTHQNLEEKLVEHMKKIVEVGEKEQDDLNEKKLLNSFELCRRNEVCGDV
jgi:hypothetical protein